MNPLIERLIYNHHDFHRALVIAKLAHHGQERKYTRDPYIVHPIEVATLVYEYTADIIAASASLLHDTIEDTFVKKCPEIIAEHVSPAVLKLVLEVTDVSKPEDGNRERRKELDRNHLGEASPLGKSIKLADLISNTRSIVQHDPEFARVYLKEKALLLPLLVDGDARLFQLAFKTLQEGQAKLVQNKLSTMESR